MPLMTFAFVTTFGALMIVTAVILRRTVFRD